MDNQQQRCGACGRSHAGSRTILGHGMSAAALAADTERSDREYQAQRQARRAARNRSR